MPHKVFFCGARFLQTSACALGAVFVVGLLSAQQAAPVISSLNPVSGAPATTVTVTGKNFQPTAGVRGSPGGGDDYGGNTVYFGSEVVLQHINSADGMTLKFDVPTNIATGIYSVTVENSKGTSNSVKFTVTKNPS